MEGRVRESPIDDEKYMEEIVTGFFFSSFQYGYCLDCGLLCSIVPCPLLSLVRELLKLASSLYNYALLYSHCVIR